ncbi:MAG: GNAT family N-acetyltransferase [Flammeovirgaceae bacterium]
MSIKIFVTDESHLPYADMICTALEESAKKRGTGIAKRSPDYIRQKIAEGKAVIALEDSNFVGFCYIETWSHEQYVANSGLIVLEKYRKTGIGRQIKQKIFELSRKKFPNAKIFGITTSLAVMKINSELGYEPVTFSELTQDDAFWAGCKSCVNYDILMRQNRKMCLCTGMLYDPKVEQKPENNRFDFLKKLDVLKRLKRIKQVLFLQKEEVA